MAFSTLGLGRDCQGDDLVVSGESWSVFYCMVSDWDVGVAVVPKVTAK